MLENNSIRQIAKTAHIPLWKVAARIGVSEPTLTRWLRFQLPPDKERLIRGAILDLQEAENEQRH